MNLEQIIQGQGNRSGTPNTAMACNNKVSTNISHSYKGDKQAATNEIKQLPPNLYEGNNRNNTVYNQTRKRTGPAQTKAIPANTRNTHQARTTRYLYGQTKHNTYCATNTHN